MLKVHIITAVLFFTFNDLNNNLASLCLAHLIIIIIRRQFLTRRNTTEVITRAFDGKTIMDLNYDYFCGLCNTYTELLLLLLNETYYSGVKYNISEYSYKHVLTLQNPKGYPRHWGKVLPSRPCGLHGT